jgi:hypothetical protein
MIILKRYEGEKEPSFLYGYAYSVFDEGADVYMLLPLCFIVRL